MFQPFIIPDAKKLAATTTTDDIRDPETAKHILHMTWFSHNEQQGTPLLLIDIAQLTIKPKML